MDEVLQRLLGAMSPTLLSWIRGDKGGEGCAREPSGGIFNALERSSGNANGTLVEVFERFTDLARMVGTFGAVERRHTLKR
jgi:hypothetical protein